MFIFHVARSRFPFHIINDNAQLWIRFSFLLVSPCSFPQFNPVCSYIFVCVTFQPIDFCSVPNLPHFRQFVQYFALQWLPIFILCGTCAQQTFGLCQLFPISQTWLVKIWPTLSLQQQLFRLNFVPTLRRNRIFCSASLRPSLQWQGSNHKT